jgi:pimeloyl-ACP methyl ester carboxylesterase
MAHFDSDGIEIAYDVFGAGAPIVLVHGFAASCAVNWEKTGWVDTLVAEGRRVIGVDCRGHGRSGKPHDRARYSRGEMQRDILRLLDHLQIEQADLFGYSMGAWLLLPLLAGRSERIHTAVLGGAGAPLPETRTLHAVICAALEGALYPTSATDLERMVAARFREFAEDQGNDLMALACVLQSGIMAAEALCGIERCAARVLVAAGDNDFLAGDPSSLATVIPEADLLLVTGGNHISTLTDDRFREGVLTFLRTHALPVL